MTASSTRPDRKFYTRPAQPSPRPSRVMQECTERLRRTLPIFFVAIV
jgi:hypothetical protein